MSDIAPRTLNIAGAQMAHARSAMCFPLENTLAFVNPHTKVKDHRMVVFYFGRGTKARTLDTRFWRPLLYQLSYTPKWCMFDSAVRACSEPSHAGAGDGNRTRTASLEGWNSTIELHPQNQRLIIVSHERGHVKRFLIFLPLFRRTFGAAWAVLIHPPSARQRHRRAERISAAPQTGGRLPG